MQKHPEWKICDWIWQNYAGFHISNFTGKKIHKSKQKYMALPSVSNSTCCFMNTCRQNSVKILAQYYLQHLAIYCFIQHKCWRSVRLPVLQPVLRSVWKVSRKEKNSMTGLKPAAIWFTLIPLCDQTLSLLKGCQTCKQYRNNYPFDISIRQISYRAFD